MTSNRPNHIEASSRIPTEAEHYKAPCSSESQLRSIGIGGHGQASLKSTVVTGRTQTDDKSNVMHCVIVPHLRLRAYQRGSNRLVRTRMLWWCERGPG